MTDPAEPTTAAVPRRVLLLGASGTIGRATHRALLARGHAVTALVRTPHASSASASAVFDEQVVADVRDARAVASALAGRRIDAVVSCLASRTGAPRDAWAIDYAAHVTVLEAARAAGASQFVLLSAICVQKARLAFQHAKLAFEAALQESGLTWSIVRPTAYFKSLSGQVRRVQAGKSFLVFGDGTLTACAPIADEDVAEYLVDCLDQPALQQRILPIGGPGPALTPRAQGALLFALVGAPPRYRSVSPRLLSTVGAVLGAVGRVIPPLADKAEFARIGHYYATESMLVWDPARGVYDADATPRTGTRTLEAHYRALLSSTHDAGLGAHALFDRRDAR
jgi:divinyl chlorophyllide a 8-vinyl-reductase